MLTIVNFAQYFIRSWMDGRHDKMPINAMTMPFQVSTLTALAVHPLCMNPWQCCLALIWHSVLLHQTGGARPVTREHQIDSHLMHTWSLNMSAVNGAYITANPTDECHTRAWLLLARQHAHATLGAGSAGAAYRRSRAALQR
jgi:hypothetical protein